MKEYKKIISISLFNRPEYTKQVLDAMGKCTGIEKYKLIISIDPGSPEVAVLAKAVKFAETQIIENPKKLGCQTNIHQAMSTAFKETSYLIHIEDDIVPAKDMLLYYEWARKQYENDKLIYTVASYFKRKNIPIPEEYFMVARAKYFHCWGWATWEDRWEEMTSQWDFGYEYDGWDVNINKRLRKERYQIYPLVARTQNIGAKNGLHVPDAGWHAKHQFNEIWAGKYDIPQNGKFHEI